MKKVLHGVAAVALALGMVSGAAAASNNGSSPSAAISMTSSASGSVTGAPTGAFEYFTFNYPSSLPTGTLTMNFSPADPVTANGVGVDLWQNGSEIASMNGVGGSVAGTNSVSVYSGAAGPVLVQVYNYNPGVPVSFQLSLNGVPVAQPAAPAPSSASSSSAATKPSTPATGTGTASSPIALTKPMSGTIAGSSTGGFAYYTEPYPGDGSTHTVTLSFSPSDLDTSNGLFVVVYQAGAEIGSTQANVTSTPGVLSIPFGSTTNAPVEIQIANYTPGTTVSYTISP